jgi:hypothetical protein
MISASVFLPLTFARLLTVFRDHPVRRFIEDHGGLKVGVPGLLLLGGLLSYRFLAASPFEIRTYPHMEPKQSGMAYPVGAVEYLKSHQQVGNVLPEFRWGEYIIWTLYPQCRVAMDGRYETVYPSDVFEGYLDFILPRDGWRHFLASYPHEIIIVNANSRIRELLGAHPGWQEKYSDTTCALLLRK